MTLPSLVGAVDGWCDDAGAGSAVVAHNIWAVTDDSLTSRAVP